VVVGAAVVGTEEGILSYAEAGVDQALDPARTGYDCAAVRRATGYGAVVGAVTGGLGAGIGAARAPKEHGSYTNTHASGKKYHGQGDRKRSQTSGRERATANNDPHIATDWSPAPNRREAYKDEAKRIGQDGITPKVRSETYNEINSPGHRYMREDGEWPW